MSLKTLLLCGSLLLLCQLAKGQNPNSPTFESFKGTVYKMPAKVVVKGYKTGMYSPGIYDYEKITEVELPALDITERADSILFPGLTIKNRFGMVLHSKMTIPKSGVYEFELSSDDGSILWIDSQLIINNDGVHKMRARRDSVYYDQGIYPVKVWYFQGVPDRYGIEMTAKYLNNTITETKEEAKKSILLSEYELKFASNSAIITYEWRLLLKDVTINLQKVGVRKISITGHTDNQGSQSYNQSLSEKRAKSVQVILQQHFKDKSIQYVIKGMGESNPIESNDTGAGRSRNRRVVIQIEYQ